MIRNMLALTAATACAVVALAGAPAHADNELDVFMTMPEASAQTARANVLHFQDIAAQAGDNISCRVEAPAFVAQPEVDGRVTVKGEATAASSAECVDIAMIENFQTTMVMTLEYFDPKLRVWVPVRNGEGVAVTRTCSSGSLRSVGVTPCVLDEVLTANNPANGKLQRVGAQLTSPKTFAPIYTENAVPTAKVASVVLPA